MGKIKRFNILVKVQDLIMYIFIMTDKSPKRCRCDIIPEVRKYALNILELVVSANRIQINSLLSKHNYEFRLKEQRNALVQIRVLENLVEICYKMKYITNAEFSHVSLITMELYDMVEKWILSDKERINSLL